MDKITVEKKDFYTMEDVLQIAKDLALDIDERTFKYYLSLEIISKPVKNPFPEGDKRIKFYPATVVDQLKRIFQLKSRGFSLKQIKKLLLQEKSKDLGVLVDVTEKDKTREMAHSFLEMLTGDYSRRAWSDFLSNSINEVTEKNLTDSVKTYLAHMVDSWLSNDESEKIVEEYFINLSSDEREKLLEPFRKGRDEEITKHKAEKMDLLRYLQKMCGRIILDRYNRLEVLDWIDRITGNLVEIKKDYEIDTTENSIEWEMYSYLKKGIDIYLEALSEIRDNLSPKKRDILIGALAKARTAHNILTHVEEILEKKNLLASLEVKPD